MELAMSVSKANCRSRTVENGWPSSFLYNVQSSDSLQILHSQFTRNFLCQRTAFERLQHFRHVWPASATHCTKPLTEHYSDFSRPSRMIGCSRNARHNFLLLQWLCNSGTDLEKPSCKKASSSETSCDSIWVWRLSNWRQTELRVLILVECNLSLKILQQIFVWLLKCFRKIWGFPMYLNEA